MSQRERIGILGGTFDPVHVGHLHVASCARQSLSLDHVVLMPAGTPPHKTDTQIASARHRYRMLELATSGISGFRPEALDLAPDAPSYTSELLERFQAHHPAADLWFVVGSDSLQDFPTWHDPQRIIQLARLAVAPRPGWDIQEILVSTQLDGLADHTDVISTLPVEISSSRIRTRVAMGQSVEWLVVAPVLEYIVKQGLYR